jgi:hypothetical protein
VAADRFVEFIRTRFGKYGPALEVADGRVATSRCADVRGRRSALP